MLYPPLSRRFRFEGAVTVHGGLQQVSGCPGGGEGATRRWRQGEVLRQLVRGAQLLLAERGEDALGLRTAVVSSLGFWKLLILFVKLIPPCDPLYFLFFLQFLSPLTRSLLASPSLFKHSLNCYSPSDTSPFLFSLWLFFFSFSILFVSPFLSTPLHPHPTKGAFCI